MIEVETMGDLANYVGRKVGVSDWMLIDQALIDRFGDATLDRNWYHMDVERAEREMPGGKTIAHGFLILSLIPALSQQIVKVRNYGQVLNYGVNKVRFISPVQVGSRIRLHSTVKAAELTSKGVMITRESIMEIEGQEKPAMIAEGLALVPGLQ